MRRKAPARFGAGENPAVVTLEDYLLLSYNGKVTGGTLVMIYSNSSENIKAGTSILNAVAPISPGPDYALRLNSGLAELNSTSAVAVYIECEFHDSPTGATWIIHNVKEIGEAICKGVCNYYGVTYKPESSGTPRPTPTGNIYKVQVGAFKDLNNAKTCRDNAIKKGFDGAFIV